MASEDAKPFIVSVFDWLCAKSGIFCWSFVLSMMVVQLGTLTRYPAMFVDEPWFSNASWSIVQTGSNFDTMHTGVLDQYGHESIRRPFVGQLPWSLSFYLFGLGFFQARLASWFLACVLLGLTYRLGCKLYSPGTGRLAIVVLSAAPGFISACHYARQDIFLASIGVGGLLLACSAFERSGWTRHFLAGLLCAGSIDIHQNGVIFVVAIACLYVGQYRWKTLVAGAAWWCVLGGVLGGTWFAYMHLWPDADLYFKLNGFSLGNYGVPITGGLLAVIRSGLLEFMRFGFHEDGLMFAVAVLSFYFLVSRRKLADRLLVTYAVGTYIGLALFVGNNSQLYRVLLLPFLVLGISECLLTLGCRKSKPPSSERWFVVGLTLLLVVYYPIVYANQVRKSFDYDYASLGQQIKTSIDDASDRPLCEIRVVAMPTWWFGLHEFEFRSSHFLGYRGWFNDESLSESLSLLRADYVVVDDDWRDNFLFEHGSEQEPFQVSREVFMEFLANQATVVDTLNDSEHGTIRIYEVSWDQKESQQAVDTPARSTSRGGSS